MTASGSLCVPDLIRLFNFDATDPKPTFRFDYCSIQILVFDVMRIWIWILLILKVMRIWLPLPPLAYGYGPSKAPFLHSMPYIVSIYGSPWLHFEPPQLLSFDFDAYPAFDSQIRTRLYSRIRI
jgi:hypothetical protein